MSTKRQTLIYRITHHKNVPWILNHGIHCRNSPLQDPGFINIGDNELISKRAGKSVPISPFGKLHDYVPFYFAPHSIMLYKIHTGQVVGVKTPQAEIVYLVSSIEKLDEMGAKFIFTDGHAYMANTNYYSESSDLKKLSWTVIQSRDFKSRPEDPDRSRQYQAECLIHKFTPIEVLLGIGCKNQEQADLLSDEVNRRDLKVPVRVKAEWYF